MSHLIGTAPHVVLVVKADTALPAPGADWSTLALGRIAFINRDGQTISSALATGTREFAAVVTADLKGDSTVNHLFRTGWSQRGKVKSYTVKCYSPGRERIMQLENACGQCDSTYSLTFTMATSKQYSWRGMALNQKTYSIETACCDEGNCVEVVSKMADEINADPNALFTAEVIATANKDDVEATPLTPEEIALLDPTEEPCPAVLRVRMNPELAAYIGCNEPNHAPEWQYWTMHLSGADDCCGGDIVTLQELHIGSGSGLAAREIERSAIGYTQDEPWNYVADGIPMRRNWQTDTAKTYVVLQYTTADESNTSAEHFTNEQTVTILFECAHTTVLASVVTLLDAAFGPAGMEALTNDIGECGCEDVQEVQDLGTTLDGIGLSSGKKGSKPIAEELKSKGPKPKAEAPKAGAPKAEEPIAEELKSEDSISEAKAKEA